MKILQSTVLLIALIGMTLVACQKDDTVASLNDELQRTTQNNQPDAPWVEKITGSGHYDVCLLPDSCLHRTFTITAQKDANGIVSGEWTRISRHSGAPGQVHSHGNVVCFNISGNYAWVGLDGDNGAFQGEGGFQLYDGGNPGAGNDSLSLSFAERDPGFAQFYCDVQPNSPALRALEQGNIRIETR